ncbi:MAG: hypothetical protein HY865_10565 [Chloroflexi bacterium]|nr:hypothetical protein [Chloroflexota bacterium]
MKRHLTEGELRASLDGELDEGPLSHLEACPDCQRQLVELKGTHLRVASRLSFLAPGAEPVPPIRLAWSRFAEQYLKQKETSMLRKWFAFPVIRYGAIAILALALLMAFPGTRALAGELLNLFRVQQVVILPIDATGLDDITGDQAFGSQLSSLISSSTIVTDEPGEPVMVIDAAEAATVAGFDARLPQEMPLSYILVSDSAAFTMKVDRAKAQGLLDGAGRSDLVLPESIDGEEILISVPSSVVTAYGLCPDPKAEKNPRGNMGNEYPGCIIFSQTPSPIVTVPEGMDMAQLAQIGLEFSGMSRVEAAAFTATVDWSTTLVVPIPRNSTTHADVSVDGVTGKLIQSQSDMPHYMLLWVKNGIVYVISGSGADTSTAFRIVDALP